MSRLSKVVWALTFGFALVSALSAMPVSAEEPSRVPAAQTAQTIGVDLVGETAVSRPFAPETDPPGVLKGDQLPAVSELAARLSRERGWLTKEILKALSARALGLDELFHKAPRYIAVDGALYRIKLEKVGDRWDGFATERDPFVVFLTHEVYDGLGDDRALGYQNGEEVILFASDFEKLPAIALTFFRLTQNDLPAAAKGAVDLRAKSSIELGRPRAQAAFKPDGLAPARPGRVAKNHCTPEVAPTGCNGTQILCPVDYQPYFVVSGLRVFENHEGCCFHGDPEIEIYPLPIDQTSGVGGTTNATTQFVFSGRTIVDVAGRTRFLPDVDDGGALFTMNVALIPSNMTSQFVGLMVEDDNEAGRLIRDNQSINVSQLLTTGFQIFQDIRTMDRFMLIRDAVSLLDILGFLNNDDDLFQPSLGATNNLFCTDALGGPFPRVFTRSSGEWELQGYFACVNATCEDGDGGGGGGGGGDDPPPCGGLQICTEQ